MVVFIREYPGMKGGGGGALGFNFFFGSRYVLPKGSKFGPCLKNDLP